LQGRRLPISPFSSENDLIRGSLWLRKWKVERLYGGDRFFSLNESFHVALFDFEDTLQADWAVAIWKSSQILETYTLEQTHLEHTTDLSA
jgi:hypothetical protein